VLTVWQVDYDQVWSFKPGEQSPAPGHSLEEVLQCPECGEKALIRTAGEKAGLGCTNCETWTPIAEDGVIEYASVVPGR
jgi:hypothetical protein